MDIQQLDTRVTAIADIVEKLTPLAPIGGLLLQGIASILRAHGQAQEAETYEAAAAQYEADRASLKAAIDKNRSEFPVASSPADPPSGNPV